MARQHGPSEDKSSMMTEGVDDNANVKPNNRMLLLERQIGSTLYSIYSTEMLEFCFPVLLLSKNCAQFPTTRNRILSIPFLSKRGRNNSSYDTTPPTLCVYLNKWFPLAKVFHFLIKMNECIGIMVRRFAVAHYSPSG